MARETPTPFMANAINNFHIFFKKNVLFEDFP